jgi:hypothetical protein
MMVIYNFLLELESRKHLIKEQQDILKSSDPYKAAREYLNNNKKDDKVQKF